MSERWRLAAPRMAARGGPVKLAAIGPDDLVLVSKGGRQFYAKVHGISSGVVRFEPIERGVSYRHASAREVVDLWRHARRRRSGEGSGFDEEAPPSLPPAGQLSLAGALERPRAKG